MISVARLDEGILDTSTVIQLAGIDPQDLPRTPLITAITLAELAVGPLITDNEEERLARQAHLLQAEAAFDPLPFDERAAHAFGAVAANLRRSGRKPAARAYDALIAAIAISRGLSVFTANPRDFTGIDRLTVVPVPVKS